MFFDCKSLNTCLFLSGSGTVRKSSRQEDVFDPGGLPPCVSGAVRAFLSMAVERLVWTSDLLEPPSAVKLKWWGQKNGGKLFRCSFNPLI